MSSSARVISRVLTCLMHRCQFSIYQQMGIIPTSITSLAHQDNLIVLCYSYHAAFDHNPPYWIMLPPVKTIQQYIVHERQDYAECTRAGLRGVSRIYNTDPTTNPTTNPISVSTRQKLFNHMMDGLVADLRPNSRLGLLFLPT